MARKNGRAVAGKPFSASTDRPTPKTRVKKKNTEPGNAYTFIPSLPKRHRTSEQTLSLSRDEEKLSRPKKGAEEDSDEDMNARIRKVAMMIAQEDKGDVDSDESSIDSDEAWEEDGSDEERWGDVFRDLDKGKKKAKKAKVEERVIKPKKPFTVNLEETDDEEEAPPLKSKGKGKAVSFPDDASEEDEDEAEDAGDSSEDEEAEDDQDEDDDEEEIVSDDGQDDNDEEDEDEDDENDEGSDVDLPSDLSEDEEDPDTLDGLDAFVEKLVEGDKKSKTVVEASQSKKRRVLPVVSAPALGDANDLGLKSNQKVDIASLIASHPSLASASSLISKSKAKSANVLNSGKLSAPLPTVVQDRINREAAYEKTKEEGAKWATMMKRVKEAEHLSFPLQGSDRGGVKSNGEILSTFKPINGHESAIQSLLAKANLTEAGVTAAEDEALQGKDLSMEEIAERRAALRQQRELMFREEARQKRVAKIKSKTFRKLARKRAGKAGEAALEDMDEEDAMVMQEKMERERAEERATLKHGAKTGRWARDSEHMHGMSEEYRSARGEMLDIKEKLKRRIEGKGDVCDEEASESDDEEGDEETIRKRAFDQLDSLDKDHQDVGEKGLLGMKFMKNAEERRRQAAREEEVEMRRDIELFGEEHQSEEEDDAKAEMLKLGSGGGRMVFAGPQSDSRNENGVSFSLNGMKPLTQNGSSAPGSMLRPRSPSPLPSTEENPWLAASSTAGPSRKRNTVLNANSSSADKSSAALKKAKSGASAEIDDNAVEIEVDGNKLLQQKKRKDVGSEDEDEQETLLPRQRVGFKQRDLVAEAFAGDNVVQEFATEKQKVIEEDAPKVEDTSLPGWGSWSGKGAKKRKPNPKFLKTTPGLLATDRKDAKFSNVIISEKKDKKASQFQVKDLPYPYTSVEQYEARFNNPLGSEWNSRGVHQRETMPRVTKKKGAIIEPVRRLF